ncbi:ABC transporter ATP-binding protein [Nonomuraea wenchangensis]|uniref:NitT/TauT family transport system ATP-binding protein n=1 Tax=Nonomuraea wenchangensis TaxID=568860 RepID=A0A1I0LB94_9ACTN|nr:ABC transporter ATP-binding protein [Nonomuraea wenchangensis]SEU37436.1 NitT/TauT family transport system ATP-binding protein [Nonomuraea wenchangensis]
MNDNRVAVRGVERVFASGHATVKALGPIDLDVRDGEFLCIVGPSGCGKSTLLRIIAGLLSPSDGEVSLRTTSKEAPLTSVVFQDYSIFPWKTVEANVRFGLDIAKVPGSVSKERVSRWLTRLGLKDFGGAYPATLSGGMKQRVSIARAFAVEPQILLMDEPFAALDAQLRQVMQAELLELWQEDGRTVIFITHNLDEAILLGDRVIVMSSRPGRVVAEVDVPFARPRSPEIRRSSEFAELEGEIWDLLRSEMKTDPRTSA